MKTETKNQTINLTAINTAWEEQNSNLNVNDNEIVWQLQSIQKLVKAEATEALQYKVADLAELMMTNANSISIPQENRVYADVKAWVNQYTTDVNAFNAKFGKLINKPQINTAATAVSTEKLEETVAKYKAFLKSDKANKTQIRVATMYIKAAEAVINKRNK